MRVSQFLTFSPDGKAIKNHTAAVWLVMVFIWRGVAGCNSKKSIDLLDIFSM
jgi:hypothetical protein